MIATTDPLRGQAARGVAVGNVDVGGALLNQAGLVTTSVVTAAGQFRYLTRESELSANGLAARTGDDRYTGQGILYAARLAAPAQRLRWEIAATASAFGVSNAGPAFGWQLLAREHVAWSLGGAFAGATGGKVVSGGFWRRVVSAHAGGFLHFDALGHDELSAAVGYTDGGVPPDNASAIRYADAISYWKQRTGVLELLVGGGLRLDGTTPSTPRSWASASAALWVGRRAALVFAAGRALEDVTRAVPSVRYVSVSLRVGLANSSAETIRRAQRNAHDKD